MHGKRLEISFVRVATCKSAIRNARLKSSQTIADTVKGRCAALCLCNGAKMVQQPYSLSYLEDRATLTVFSLKIFRLCCTKLQRSHYGQLQATGEL